MTPPLYTMPVVVDVEPVNVIVPFPVKSVSTGELVYVLLSEPDGDSSPEEMGVGADNELKGKVAARPSCDEVRLPCGS